ncbi:MAG TPA: NmrA family NAD(P)-binding protein [Gemmatimonadaceae bacterium]|nr:NmrA family NAD(P)-binding protein [Gemmatimonadaceae bacterium]
MSSSPVILAGATGNLGGRIARAIVARGGSVRAIVRPDADRDTVAKLRRDGVTVVEADFGSATALAKACEGGACVVSALAGLRDVIVDAQSALLGAALGAGVPRFFPSDFALDFTKLPDGLNRNLDLRREFHRRLDRAPIAATSVLNGMFADLLTGQAPIVILKLKRVVYWKTAEQPMDFTTIDDVASFTAAAALDPATPRFLRVAGDRVNARELAAIASELAGEEFRTLRAGGLRRLERIIRIARAISPGKDQLYPPWQGMQYLHNMFDGRALLEPLDNDRYPGMRWTPVRETLAQYVRGKGSRTRRRQREQTLTR